MAEEPGAAEAQEPQLDDFDKTLGGTLDESPETPATPAPNGTPAFDPGTWNAENGSLDEVPEEARPYAEAFQRRAREISGGVSTKIGEVNQYEQELKEARERIERLESSQPEPEVQRVPGQNAAAIAEAMGVDRTNSTEQAIQSMSTVADIIDHHPLATQVATLAAELAALKESTGEATNFVTEHKDQAYQTEYAAAVQNHGKDITDRVIGNYGDMRGRAGLDGNPLTVDGLVAQMTGKAAAAGAEIDAAAEAARASARATAGGVPGTSGLSVEDIKEPTDADIERVLSQGI